MASDPPPDRGRFIDPTAFDTVVDDFGVGLTKRTTSTHEFEGSDKVRDATRQYAGALPAVYENIRGLRRFRSEEDEAAGPDQQSAIPNNLGYIDLLFSNVILGVTIQELQSSVTDSSAKGNRNLVVRIELGKALRAVVNEMTRLPTIRLSSLCKLASSTSRACKNRQCSDRPGPSPLSHSQMASKNLTSDDSAVYNLVGPDDRGNVTTRQMSSSR